MIRIETKYKHLSRKIPAPRCFILHTTGDTDIDEIVHYYTNSSSGIAPHYLIDYDGTVTQFVDEDKIAYHAGYGSNQALLELYKLGWNGWCSKFGKELKDSYSAYPGYATWYRRWCDDSAPLPVNDSYPRKRGFLSPFGLKSGNSPNSNSIGIECRASKHSLPEAFTPEQYSALTSLIYSSGQRNKIQLVRDNILGHYDTNPISRGNKSGDWDPGENFNWNRLMQGLANIEPAPAGFLPDGTSVDGPER